MSSPVKKKKTSGTTSPILSPTPQLTNVPSLPDDLLISVFARVSRLEYPILSLVSKRFRSLLASPELYKTRSFLGHTERCLYVCLRFPPDSNPRWFTLCRKPKSSGHAMAAISISNSPPTHWLCIVADGSDIYSIGGSIYKEYSSKVSILDCRSYTWREGPSMLEERSWAAANIIDGKIYVVGGCKKSNSSNWMEAFDLKTRTWEHVFTPIRGICETSICKSAVIEKAIYLFGRNFKVVAYNPKIDRWEAKRGMECLHIGRRWPTYGVIDNILYCYHDFLGLQWFDSKIGRWITLKVLEGLPKFGFHEFVGFADYGGKMAAFWDKYLPCNGYYNKEIWCAVITLGRRDNEEIYGKVEWLDAVLTVPVSCEFVCACAATV